MFLMLFKHRQVLSMQNPSTLHMHGLVYNPFLTDLQGTAGAHSKGQQGYLVYAFKNDTIKVQSQQYRLLVWFGIKASFCKHYSANFNQLFDLLLKKAASSYLYYFQMQAIAC
jgi:hypothetical protein